MPLEYTPPPAPPSIKNLSYLSTEHSTALTATLSQTMHNNCIEGLAALHQIDQNVLTGFAFFAQHYLRDLKQLLQTTLTNDGRCFLVGSGSSGRVALDLAAKSNNPQVIGIIAGGDSAFIRAREGFEDSAQNGSETLQQYKLTANDLVILISASGSATFNVGCAQEARTAQATVCYFYNSTQVPQNTQVLFDHLGVLPILVDIGPQAIVGSTRLQAATLAELALGCLLSGEEPELLLQSLMHGNTIIQEHFADIAQIIALEYAAFTDPLANFRRLTDETECGYVTFIADHSAIREVITDTVETAPTFSTNPPRTPAEHKKKRAEFQAYLVTADNNEQAWQTLLNRAINAHDIERIMQFDITHKALLATRPIGVGNVVIGVAKEEHHNILRTLNDIRQSGARTALIVIPEKRDPIITAPCDAALILNGIVNDGFGLVHTIILKQVLNLISNGSMILMNKVDGNQMIDVSASNNKLVDRTIRLIQDIFKRYRNINQLDYDQLLQTVRSICQHKKEYEEKNIYTPAPVKIAVTMIYKGFTFAEAIEFLYQHNERLESVFTL